MASSFHIFRRNQKLMLAVLTLMAMFAFVFLDPLLKYFGDNQAIANPVEVETKYGNLRRSDLENMAARRQLTAMFLGRLAIKMVANLEDQGRLDLRAPWLRDYQVKQLQERFLQYVMRSVNPGDRREIVNTMLLDKEAQSRDVIISDEAIKLVLKQLTENTVSEPEMARLIRDLPDANEQLLFDSLRSELLASTVLHNFRTSVMAFPPAEMWDYYKRLHQQAEIEALPVSVSDFVDRVAEPTDEELKAFFDEHKDQFAIPGSPEPGFKLPRRQRFQYFKAELDLFRQLAKVTDEEVKKYYEDNKESFRKLELPKDAPATDEQKKSLDDPEPETDSPSTPSAAESEATPVPAEKPAVAPAEQAAPSAKEPPPAKTSPAPSATPKAKPAPKSNQKSFLDRPSQNNRVQFRLVADEKTSNADPKAKAPETEQPAAQPTTTPTESNESNKPETETPAGQEKPDAEKPTEQKPDAEKPVEPKYSPLEEVKDQIIRVLKDEKARTEIRQGMDELASLLSDFSELRSTYNSTDPNAKPPREPNFVELAKQHSFGFEGTELVSESELQSDKSGFGTSRYGEVPIGRVMFEGRAALYTPVVSEDLDGNIYLSWKTEEVADQVPEFKDAREEVLKAWKMIKARDLARKQAETYAAEAAGAKKTLGEYFTGDKTPKVITAGPFSWMTLGTTADNAQRGIPMLSDVPGIENPSMEFMRTVFNLDQDSIGVAKNGSEDIYYVVQVIKYQPPVEEMETDFARADPRSYFGIIMMEKQKLMRDWLASVEQRADLKWIIEPSDEEQ
jgi:hypothetical protein